MFVVWGVIRITTPEQAIMLKVVITLECMAIRVIIAWLSTNQYQGGGEYFTNPIQARLTYKIYPKS
jgi:hypothetical protein